ncbi:MAG: LysE family translocator [bacterium]
MNYELITALVAFSFVSSGTPGPNNLMLLASGANFGLRRTAPHLLGVVIGFTIMIMLVGIGLMQLFTAVPATYWILKTASIAYLLYLSWKIATAAPFGDHPEYAKIKPKPFTFVQAALFQWVNPKAWTMALTAISAYTPPSHPWRSVFLVAIVFGSITLPSSGVWVVAGTQVRKVLDAPRKLRVFNLTMALLLIGSLYPILFE